MDKYNIIVPTTDLDELTIDMTNWYNMNFNMRMRSNDDCMAIYGCTVPELYNKIKEKILAGEDWANADDNNIVRESVVDFSKYDRYEDRLTKSRMLQSSPFVVIIDPDINSFEELYDRFNAFNLLSEKDKRLSNDYSYNLWGFNAYEMYNKLFKKLNTLDAEEDYSNNLIVTSESSEIDKYIATLNENILWHNRLVVHDPVVEANMYYGELESIKESKSKVNAFNDKYKPIEEDFHFPKYIPYMSESELMRNNIQFKYDHHNKNYAYNLIEAYRAKDNDMILSLGWNPYIPLNEDTLKEAHDKAVNHVVSLWDLSQIKMENVNPHFDKINAVFIIKSMTDNVFAISFNASLQVIFEFTGNDNFEGLRKLTKEEYSKDPRYEFVDVSIFFLDFDSYDKLLQACDKLQNVNKVIPGFDTIMGFIQNSNSAEFDREPRIQFTHIIDLLIKLANFDLDAMTFGSLFARSKNGIVYRIFKGKMEDYDVEKIDQLLHIIYNNQNIADYAKENAMNEAAEQFIINAIKPRILIYSLSD